jgi:glycosyltransferase involved in cell wall biosynthesis
VRILIVHQYYVAPGEAGGSRFNEFAQAWARAGHDVVVVCGSLNYATGSVAPHLRRKWIWSGVEDGIAVRRCHVPATYNKSYAGRMWAFFGFTLSSTVAAVRAPRPDIVIATSPPLTAGLTGWFAAKWHRRPWVFEIRDLWPESAVTTGVLHEGSVMTRLLYGIERFCCRHATGINVLTPAFRENLTSRGLAEASRIEMIPNGADLELFRPGDRHNDVRRALGWGDRFVALYAGAHGRANGLDTLIEAATLLQSDPNILLVTVGDGPERERLQAQATARHLTNLAFLGSHPKAEMPSIVQACDAGLAILQKNPTFLTVYPNKVFDYMAAARPTILNIDGVARTLVCDDARAGVFCPPGDARALANAIRAMASAPDRGARLGEQGRAWAEAHASRSALAGKYLNVLSRLARRT